jgi:hypothetical protein
LNAASFGRERFGHAAHDPPFRRVRIFFNALRGHSTR